MATSPIPTIQNGGGPLDNIINSVVKNLGGGSQTQTTAGGFSNQLQLLLNNLVTGGGAYGRDQAIADATGPMAQLAQDTLQRTVPQAAAQVRGSGLYNSSTKALLDNDASARLATQMASLVQKNITDYATISANNANVAANANRTNTTQTTGPKSGSSGLTALAGPLAGLLANEGKKFLGGLFDGAKDPIASAATTALGGVADYGSASRDSIMDIFGGGGLGGATTGVEGGDQFLGSLAGLGDNIGDTLGGVTDGITDTLTNAGGGLADFFGNLGGGVTDLFGGITDSLGDLFGGLFADGGKVPVKDRGIGAVGDDRYGGGKSKDAKPAPDEGVMSLLKQLFPDNIFDSTSKKREKNADPGNDGGKIGGPQSKSGADNMLIGVQGGEYIIPPDVASIPGVEKLLDQLIDQFHTSQTA